MKKIKIILITSLLVTLTGCLSQVRQIQSAVNTLQLVANTGQRISNIGKTPQQIAASRDTGVTSFLSGIQNVTSGVSNLSNVGTGLNGINNTLNSVETISHGMNQIGSSRQRPPSSYPTASHSSQSLGQVGASGRATSTSQSSSYLGSSSAYAYTGLSPSSSNDLSIGKQIYDRAFGRGCGACHNISSNPDLFESARTLTEYEFTSVLKNGKNGMPKAAAAIMAVSSVKNAGYSESQALRSVYAYLRSERVSSSKKSSNYSSQRKVQNLSTTKPNKYLTPSLVNHFNNQLKKAQQGVAEAQVSVGTNYKHGIGVKKNIEQAKYWLHQAANQGHARGNFFLGSLLHGEGNSEDAKYWLRMAADRGDKDCLMMLGVITSGSEKKKWLRMAAAQGSDLAGKLLEIYNK